MRISTIVFFILCLPYAFAQSLQVDEATGPKTLNIFMDCSSCDMNFIREEINYVNYVRDRKIADVHVFITQQPNGSGAILFTFSFIGQNELEKLNQNFTWTRVETISQDVARKGMVTKIQLGLVPFLAQLPVFDQLSVRVKQSNKRTPQPNFNDPWRNWIFEVFGSGNWKKESQKSSLGIRYGLEVNRTTALWRIYARSSFSYNEQSFINNGELISSKRTSNSYFGKVVKSINEHWSAGVFNRMYSSTYSNTRLGLSLNPAIEYSFFPYSEVNRREVTLAYNLGPAIRRYNELTIYDKLEENLWRHSLKMAIRIREPWGSVFAGLEGAQYLHDGSKHSLDIDSNVNFRLVKGLALRLSGNFELIRDQLSLPKGGASLEDILLQQTQLATNYKAYASVGVSYTFGSIYNNIVNTRL